MSNQDKKEYFKSKVKRINTLHQHMDLTADSIEFVILADIVDTIIGDIFFRNDEQLLHDNNSDDDTTTVKTVTTIQQAKDYTKMAKLAGINDLIIGQYVRVMVAATLQNISDIIDNEFVWEISLAGDNNTHRGQSFFDLRLCACYCGDLTNLHLVIVPMFERHTAENMFNMVIKFFDALYDWWRDKLDRSVVQWREHDD
ncbi:unnamed protein product [Sphagnum jensenii]|uniref:Uncharacterized protein n=1 Tax=Sphagnum jensenii TaxID=128206 RepID=A0ABP0WQU0_9BRYO